LRSSQSALALQRSKAQTEVRVKVPPSEGTLYILGAAETVLLTFRGHMPPATPSPSAPRPSSQPDWAEQSCPPVEENHWAVEAIREMNG